FTKEIGAAFFKRLAEHGGLGRVLLLEVYGFVSDQWRNFALLHNRVFLPVVKLAARDTGRPRKHFRAHQQTVVRSRPAAAQLTDDEVRVGEDGRRVKLLKFKERRNRLAPAPLDFDGVRADRRIETLMTLDHFRQGPGVESPAPSEVFEADCAGVNIFPLKDRRPSLGRRGHGLIVGLPETRDVFGNEARPLGITVIFYKLGLPLI